MIQLAIALVVGIVLAYVFPISFPIINIIVVGFAVLLLIWFYFRNRIQAFPLFEILSIVLFIGIGYANYQLRKPYFNKTHYTKFISENDSEILQIKIKEVLKPSSFQDKYIAEVIQINTNKSRGNILVNFQRDSTKFQTLVDDVLILYTEIKEINPPLNPDQFNYKKYMQNLGIYYQINDTKKAVISINKGISTLKGQAEKLRNFLMVSLKNQPIEKTERSIIEALILGQRRNIDSETYAAYASAGAIHILAVSGLHVGIIFFIISWLLKPMGYLKFGNIIKSITIVIMLWGFAFLAGLSPSVIRAVTMFSFFALANLTNRPSNSFNVLFISLFFLLLINPNWLFQVGFQMSYLAVFFIIWLHPKLNKLYQPKFKLDKLLWDIFTVTIATQIGIAPLSIYYFNQFPGLFFISNLVILPFLSLILGYGILVVLLAGIDMLPNSLAVGYNYLIKALNNFIYWVAEKESFLFKEINISFLKMIGIYLLIISFIVWLSYYNRKWVLAILTGFVFILGVSFNEKYTEKEVLVIFQKSRKTIIANASKDTLKIFLSDSISVKNEYPIKQFQIKNRRQNILLSKIPSVFNFKEKTFVVVDSLGVYPKIENAIILLQSSPKVNLDRLIIELKPELIIADGNNYTSYVKRWEKTCIEKNIPFYATRNKGAYIIN